LIAIRAFLAVASLTLVLPAYAQQQAPPPPQEEEQPVSYEEQVVVTASRSEQQLVNAPAAMTLVGAQTIQNSPAINIGELLRSVPGLNVMQASARDINITTRGATSTLSTSQLALVDGRSVYLDFFGMVMWDLVPTNPSDIRQIEVIRGPASAVWGANAMSGVVNVITKTPRELAAQGGTSLAVGVGAFNRSVADNDADSGSLFYVNGSHAQAVNDRWAFKLSAGYFTQDPMARPVGTIPNAFNTPYPSFANEGTSQPKFDARADYDLAGGGAITISGGVAGTEGLIHTGIGPFDIDSDSRMTYVTTRYQKEGRRLAFFTNLLQGDAANLLAFGVDQQPLPLVFDTKTFDFEASDVRAIGTRHVLTYGGNFRRNTFDISLAPDGDDRSEGGGFLQDEIFLSEHFRWVVGGRVDKFSSIDDPVFSPRTTFMIKPAASQTFRVSFNRAFRAPSFINNHISTTILNEANLSGIVPLLGPLPPPLAAALTQQLSRFVFPIRATGNPDLSQESMTAYELGYAAVVAGRATVSAAVYWNVTKDGIYFTPNAFYTGTNPPPTWPSAIIPPQLIFPQLAARGILLPANFTYLNLGTIKDKGFELGVDAPLNQYVNAFTNYSYQAMPVAEDLPAGTSINDVNWPPRHHVNAGFDFGYRRFLGNMSVNYTDEAYWQDVLDARYAGTTEAYTLVNAGFGVRWAGERVVTSVKIMNLANQEVMQHIFGDVLKRQIVGEARFTF